MTLDDMPLLRSLLGAVYSAITTALPWFIIFILPLIIGSRFEKLDRANGTLVRFYLLAGAVIISLFIFQLMKLNYVKTSEASGAEGYLAIVIGVPAAFVLAGYAIAWIWNKLGFSK